MAGAGRPQAVLFACGLNTVRSPMAERIFKHLFGSSVYVASAGVRKGELDPFAVAVMDEIGLDIARHRPKTFEELEDWEGLNFDVIISLSPEAHHRAPDPTDGSGNREQRLDAYRAVRDQLLARIKKRFASGSTGNE